LHSPFNIDVEDVADDISSIADRQQQLTDIQKDGTQRYSFQK
jgi:hypothetical protein